MKLGSTSVVAPGGRQRRGNIGPEIAVVGGVDPQCRDLCPTTVGPGRLDETVRRTYYVGLAIGVSATTAREVDHQPNAGWVPGREGERCPSAGRHPGDNHARPINKRLPRHVAKPGLDIVRGP